MTKRMYAFSVVVIEDEDRGNVSIVPELPECQTQRDNLGGITKNIKETIELYPETLSEEYEKEFLSRKNLSLP